MTRIRKTLLTGLVLSHVLVFVVGTFSGYRFRDSKSERGRFNASVVNVVDADTIDVAWYRGTNRVRLIGVDAPETRRGSNLEKQAGELGADSEMLLTFGKQAVEKLGAMIEGKQVVLYFPDRKIGRDAFGRYLAYVYLDDLDIGNWLLQEGLAWARKEPHPQIEAYERENRRARLLRSGVHALGKKP